MVNKARYSSTDPAVQKTRSTVMVDDKLWEEMKAALNNIHVTNTYIEHEREVASPSAGLVDGKRVGVHRCARHNFTVRSFAPRVSETVAGLEHSEAPRFENFLLFRSQSAAVVTAHNQLVSITTAKHALVLARLMCNPA